jgi:pantothenate kinase type III
MGGNPSIVLTGGGAHEFYNELSGDVHVFEDLVLKGLEIMADKV